MTSLEKARARLQCVTTEESGQRLDNFLLRHTHGVPKTRIYRAIRKGEVRVNKGRTKADYRVVGGDEIRIPPLSQVLSQSADKPSLAWERRIRESIVCETDDFLAINKPTGLAVHGGSGVRLGLIESLRRLFPDERSEGRRRRQRRTSESSVAEEAVTVTETASPEPATTDVATGQTLEVASSEALSAAFEATSPTNSVEAEFQVEPSAPETPVPSADVQKAAPSPVEPSDTVTDQTSAEVIGNVIGALVRDTSGMTDSGRAVNDPRISPKPITQTQIVTEQAQLFALPEGPPVSIIRQDIPRAGNDPRGPRAQMATAE